MRKWIIILLAVFIMVVASLTAETVKKDKPLVVILPGLACPPDSCAVLNAGLQADYDCHLLDWTEMWIQSGRDGAPLDFLIEGIVDCLDRFKPAELTLIGHSMGGWLALGVAAAVPERVRRLVVIDSAPFPGGLYQDIAPDQARTQAEQFRDALKRMSPEQYQSFDSQRMAMLIDDESWQKRLLDWAGRYPRAEIATLMGAMAAADLRRVLVAIEADTLVLASSRMAGRLGIDTDSFGTRLRNQYQSLRRCTVQLTGQAGHFIMIDEPDWLMEKVRAFLEPR